MAALTVLAQLSDPHVEVGTGDDGSSQALAAAVRAVLRLEPLPDAVLVSGDLTNAADAASYARARELLDALPWRCTCCRATTTTGRRCGRASDRAPARTPTGGPSPAAACG